MTELSLTASLTERLAARLAEPVDAATRARARLHLIDWLGCVAGALGEPVAAVARAAEPDPLTRAALLGNVLEMDDVDRLGRLHPGPVIWPAALSAARDEGATLGRLLDGAVRGYEAMIAIGRRLDDHHYGLWHPTATAGGFGASAAAASIYGLTPTATADALGNAGSLAGGLWRLRHEPVMTKALHVAHAGLAGLWFARLARHGFTGPRFILEGEQGVFAAMTRAPRPPAPPAEAWRMFEVSFKPWAACRHAHPAIEVALAARMAGALAGDDIVEIATYRDAVTFCDRPGPVTVNDAKFSIQHAVAVVIARGAPALADFEPDAIADPALVAARGRVRVVEDTALSAAYPAHFGARLRIGDYTTACADTLGDPERPMDRDAIVDKARGLMAWGGVRKRHARLAVELALDCDEELPAKSLVKLLTKLVQ